MCSLVKPVENDDSHTFSQSPSPCSPHFKLPGFFILYPINIPAPCLWEDGPETSDLRAWLIQYSSVTQSCLTLCDPMDCSTPGLPVHHQLLESTQTHAHWVGDAIQPSHPLSSTSPPASLFPSIRVFSNESVLIRRPKYWSLSFSISPSNEYSGLISFRMDWLDLLAFEGTLKSLLQHHSSKASILLWSAFSVV